MAIGEKVKSGVEKVKSGATWIAAVAGSLTALWGVYEKVRSDAREDTAASYNMLAPQLNQMSEALKVVQAENQLLKQVLLQSARGSAGDTAGEEKPPARAERARASAAKKPAARNREVDPGQRQAAPPPPAATAIEPTSAPAPATAPTSDPLQGLLHTVNRTRRAVEDIRKVPDTFEKVLEQRK